VIDKHHRTRALGVDRLHGVVAGAVLGRALEMVHLAVADERSVALVLPNVAGGEGQLVRRKRG
jgi:hypothetical protein